MSGTEISRMGHITVEDDFATIEFERHVKHPAQRVCNAITEQDKLSKWYLCKVKIDGGQGGRIDLWFGNTHVYGEIITWEEPRIFEHEWNIDPGEGLSDGERTILRWELIEEGKGTIIKLSHINLTKNTAFGMTEGIEPATSNHIILDRLQAFLNSEPLSIGADQIYSLREAYRKLGNK